MSGLNKSTSLLIILAEIVPDAAPIKQVSDLFDGHIRHAYCLNLSRRFQLLCFFPDSADFPRADVFFESEDQRVGVFEVHFGED